MPSHNDINVSDSNESANPYAVSAKNPYAQKQESQNPYSVGSKNPYEDASNPDGFLVSASLPITAKKIDAGGWDEPNKYAWDRYGTGQKALLGGGQAATLLGARGTMGKAYGIGNDIYQAARAGSVRSAYTGQGWSQAADSVRAGANQVKNAKGFTQTMKGVGNTLGGVMHYAPVVDAGFALHGAYDDLTSKDSRGAHYGGGFWGKTAGALEGAANGLTAGGYDAVRSFNFGKTNQYSHIGTVNRDPLGAGKLAEKLAGKFFDAYDKWQNPTLTNNLNANNL
jgi:hypothetical protein